MLTWNCDKWSWYSIFHPFCTGWNCDGFITIFHIPTIFVQGEQQPAETTWWGKTSACSKCVFSWKYWFVRDLILKRLFGYCTFMNLSDMFFGRWKYFQVKIFAPNSLQPPPRNIFCVVEFRYWLSVPKYWYWHRY